MTREVEEVLDERINIGPACLPHSPGDALVAGVPTSRIACYYFDAKRRRSSANQTCRGSRGD
jgi:hypothetical protein